jgi:hypothetical protein
MSAARSSTNPNRARKEADICDPRLIVEGPFSDSVRVEANRVFRIGGTPTQTGANECSPQSSNLQIGCLTAPPGRLSAEENHKP